MTIATALTTTQRAAALRQLLHQRQPLLMLESRSCRSARACCRRLHGHGTLIFKPMGSPRKMEVGDPYVVGVPGGDMVYGWDLAADLLQLPLDGQTTDAQLDTLQAAENAVILEASAHTQAGRLAEAVTGLSRADRPVLLLLSLPARQAERHGARLLQALPADALCGLLCDPVSPNVQRYDGTSYVSPEDVHHSIVTVQALASKHGLRVQGWQLPERSVLSAGVDNRIDGLPGSVRSLDYVGLRTALWKSPPRSTQAS